MNYPDGGAPGGGPPQGPPNQGNNNMYSCPPNAVGGPQWSGYPQQGGHMPQQPAPPYYASHQMPPGTTQSLY